MRYINTIICPYTCCCRSNWTGYSRLLFSSVFIFSIITVIVIWQTWICRKGILVMHDMFPTFRNVVFIRRCILIAFWIFPRTRFRYIVSPFCIYFTFFDFFTFFDLLRSSGEGICLGHCERQPLSFRYKSALSNHTHRTIFDFVLCKVFVFLFSFFLLHF